MFTSVLDILGARTIYALTVYAIDFSLTSFSLLSMRPVFACENVCRVLLPALYRRLSQRLESKINPVFMKFCQVALAGLTLLNSYILQPLVGLFC